MRKSASLIVHKVWAQGLVISTVVLSLAVLTAFALESTVRARRASAGNNLNDAPLPVWESPSVVCASGSLARSHTMKCPEHDDTTAHLTTYKW